MLLPLLLSSLLATSPAPAPAPAAGASSAAPAAPAPAPTEEQAVALLFAGEKRPDLAAQLLVPWKAHPGTWLVTAAWPGEDESGMTWKVRVGWVGLEGGAPRLLASSGTTDVEFSEPLSYVDGFGFDFAPYRLTPTETALGLRLRLGYNSTARNSSNERLVLFRLVDKRLAAVFQEEMDSSGVADKESGESFSESFILIVSQKKTDGFFDLIVKPKTGKGASKVHRWNAQEGRYP